jgi:general stress protein 26
MTDHLTEHTSSDEATAKVAGLIKGIRVAMLTSIDPQGRLVSRPMATQDVEFDGDVWFIAERSAEHTLNLRSRPQVNVAFAGSSSWVSLAGTAEVVDDPARLEEYWNTFTDAWMEGGPDNPENILIHVHADTAEYWDSPGSKVTQVVNLVKAKVTGERYEGDNMVVEL